MQTVYSCNRVIASRYVVSRSRSSAIRCNSEQQQYYALPRNVQEMNETSVESIKRANNTAQARRHIIEYILPVNEKRINFMSTEAMDYPESTFAEFERIVGLAKNFIARLLNDDSVAIKVQRIDEGGIDGDLCAVVSSADLSVVCMVWPTAGKLKQLKSVAEDKRIGQLVVINPLWKTQGNLMSELGIGPWRKANEEFVGSFELSYMLYEQRIGAPSSVNLARGGRYESGGVLRTQRCYPGPFEVHAMAPNGISQALGKYELAGGKPTYQKLEGLIVEGRKAKLEIFEVARQASSLAIERGDASTSPKGEEGAGSESRSFYSRDQVLDMDLAKLRRVLMGLGLPTSGALPKLQARVLAISDAVDGGKGLEEGMSVAKALR